MTASMTGFAAYTSSVGSYNFAIELKSVNHRSFEIGFHLPDELRAIETPIRELLGQRISRGKLDCRVSLRVVPQASSLIGLNDEVLERLSQLQEAVRQRFTEAKPLSVSDILRWPGMIQETTLASDTLAGEVLAGMAVALEDLVQTRLREGAKLKQHIELRLADAQKRLSALETDWPRIANTLQEKLKQRLQAALHESAHERLAQEVALYAQKMDIEEERVRLATHLSEVQRVLDQGGVVGKRLDFLMQELNREANTLGAKSVDFALSQISLDLKVLIEQMREQVQNLE